MKSVSDIRARLKFVKVIYVPFEVRFAWTSYALRSLAYKSMLV